MSPQSSLDRDIIVVAELQRRGALSHELMEHMAMFLNDRARALDPAQSQPTECQTPVRRQRAEEAEAPGAGKRHCPVTIQSSRPEPRRRREKEGMDTPSPAPSIPANITNTPSTTFADALRAPGPSHPAQPPAASQTTTALPAPQKPRLPPLIVEVLPNWASHFKTLRDRLGHAPNARPFGKGVRFSPCSEDEYRIVQRYLSELETREHISWFSYALPAEKSRKVAIRGLPVTTTPEEIKDALAELGFTAEYVRPIKARKGRPGCIFFAILANTPDLIPGIYSVTELLYMPGITIEAWRSKKGPAQCHRCQAFRHSSHGCHRRQACVRCGEEHLARDCPRPLEVPATCANCGGAHPANYSACPQYKREALNKRAGTVALTREDSTRKPRTAAPRVSSNTVGAENTAPNLMAPANPAIERGGRRYKKRGGKRTKRQKANESLPPPASQMTTAAASVAAPRTTSATTRQPTHAIIDRAIDTLKEVLIALREGRDPVQCVLSGMSNLLLHA